MLEDAKKWNEENPEARVSQFACKYPNKYREAANALRRVRREIEDNE